MDSQQTMDKKMMWYIVAALVVVALIFWYVSGTQQPTPATGTPTASTNSTAAIAADLNQTSDGSVALSQDGAASAQAVAGF